MYLLNLSLWFPLRYSKNLSFITEASDCADKFVQSVSLATAMGQELEYLGSIRADYHAYCSLLH